jgi:hypothetical protein
MCRRFSTLRFITAAGAVRAHDLSPRGTSSIREDQRLSQRLYVGQPFQFCAGAVGVRAHGDPTRLHNFANSERCFELADAPLKTGDADFTAPRAWLAPLRAPTQSLTWSIGQNPVCGRASKSARSCGPVANRYLPRTFSTLPNAF